MVIQIYDQDNIPPNESIAICQTTISTSNVQKNKIPRFACKKFESSKINDEVQTSANRKGNNKMKKKTSQQNSNSKI